MKKFVFGLLAAATLGSVALPAAAQVVIRENRHGDVVVRHDDHRRYGGDRYERHHRAHRVVWFDRRGHRHVEWR
jgi:hypothetical protein